MVYAKRSLAKIDVSWTTTEQWCRLVRFLYLGFFFFLFFCLIHAIVGVRHAWSILRTLGATAALRIWALLWILNRIGLCDVVI